jgi:malate dehydrogenase (oxaloacetate-decarboxylating)
MAKDTIIFACANPVPEIWPWEPKEAGAAIVATGRSDFPNQVNNSLSSPGIFRGVLDVRARKITDEMCFAAASALSDAAKDQLDEEHILPEMFDMTIYPLQAATVGIKAQEQDLAQRRMSYKPLPDHADSIISRAQAAADMLMREGLISQIPDD